jgi:hypothetical protein
MSAHRERRRRRHQKEETTHMKRSLLTIRLFTVALLLVIGIVFTGTAAHAAPQASAARSTWVIVRNNSKWTLSAPNYYLTSGVWTVKPNSVILPGQESSFGSESSGFMTGTRGVVDYFANNGQEITMIWSNPYVGSNSYTVWISGTASGGKILVTRSGGSGNNAVVTFTISNAL